MLLVVVSMTISSLAFRGLSSSKLHRHPVPAVARQAALTTSDVSNRLHTVKDMLTTWRTHPPSAACLDTAIDALEPLVHAIDDGDLVIRRRIGTVNGGGPVDSWLQRKRLEGQHKLMTNLYKFFVFYICDPAFGDWEEVVMAVSVKREALDNGEISLSEYNAFVEPYTSAIGFDCWDVICCGGISFLADSCSRFISPEEQDRCIEQCERTEFIPSCKDLAAHFIAKLKAVPKKVFDNSDWGGGGDNWM